MPLKHSCFQAAAGAAEGRSPAYLWRRNRVSLNHVSALARRLRESQISTGVDIREVRVRADAGFGFNPVMESLEARPAQYPVVARLTQAFKRLLPGLPYESVNQRWEMAEFEHRPHGWPQARRFVVARRFIPEDEPQTTLFTLGRYLYRAWVTNMDLTPAGIWHFYDGRAGMEPRICELREDFALRKWTGPHF